MNNKTVPDASFELMLAQMEVQGYRELPDKARFIDALRTNDSGTGIDYQLLQACLNVYKATELSNESPQSGIIRMLLAKFNQNAGRVVEYLDIDNNGSISKSEFMEGARRIASRYDNVVIFNLG